MKKIIVPLAPGFEEIEALTVVDILRRAGAEVTLAGTIEGPIEGRSRIKVLTDASLDAVMDKDYDMVVLPGGAVGAENLKKDLRVKKIIEGIYKKGAFVTAICAAPKVLSAIGITKGKNITSHPTVRGELEGNISEERVVIDGNLVTSQGPGTAMEFSFKLVEMLYGQDAVKEVNKGVLAKM